MSTGDIFSPVEVEQLKRALRYAGEVCGLEFSLYVGDVEGDARAYAVRLHGSLDDTDHAVLVLCDLASRDLEIVTGREARRRLGDRECALAAAAMQSSFVAGDLTGGLVDGIQQLGESARAPRTLHAKG